MEMMKESLNLKVSYPNWRTERKSFLLGKGEEGGRTGEEGKEDEKIHRDLSKKANLHVPGVLDGE